LFVDWPNDHHETGVNEEAQELDNVVGKSDPFGGIDARGAVWIFRREDKDHASCPDTHVDSHGEMSLNMGGAAVVDKAG